MIPGAGLVGWRVRETRRLRANFMARRRRAERMKDPEYKARYNERKAREVRARMRAPAAREARRESGRALYATNRDYREAAKARSRAWRADPANRSAILAARARHGPKKNAARRTDEYRSRRAAQRRERYATDAEYRARRRERSRVRGYRKHLGTLLLRQGFRCALCGDVISSEDYRHTAQVDHVVPVSKGGGDGIENLQAVHMHCNASKGART